MPLPVLGSTSIGWSAGLKSVRDGLFQSNPNPRLESNTGTEILVFAWCSRMERRRRSRYLPDAGRCRSSAFVKWGVEESVGFANASFGGLDIKGFAASFRFREQQLLRIRPKVSRQADVAEVDPHFNAGGASFDLLVAGDSFQVALPSHSCVTIGTFGAGISPVRWTMMWISAVSGRFNFHGSRFHLQNDASSI